LLTVTVIVGILVSCYGADCGGCFCAPGNGTCPDWVPKSDYTASEIEAFTAKRMINPAYTLDCNPYHGSNCNTSPELEVDTEGAVCAFKYSNSSTCDEYTMKTYSSETKATEDGAYVTHTHACGLCSTAQDLAVYLKIPDMTKAGKKCAEEALISEEWGLSCYKDLGYSDACATIWNYDGMYDSEKCKWTCIKNLFADNNGPPPECALNPCLQCDEDEAGPIFQQFARRTRRRSGITSAIIRGCDEFAQITHVPCPPQDC